MPQQPECPSPAAMERKLEEVMSKVRALPPGGDLEGLLEASSAELKLLLYQAAARQRRQAHAAAAADFPPSGL